MVTIECRKWDGWKTDKVARTAELEYFDAGRRPLEWDSVLKRTEKLLKNTDLRLEDSIYRVIVIKRDSVWCCSYYYRKSEKDEDIHRSNVGVQGGLGVYRKLGEGIHG